MKAIIPVAGAGTKLRPLTYTQPKALIPLAGRTLLSIIVDQLVEAGVDDFVFVTGYLGDKIQDYVDRQYPNLRRSYIHQADRRGIGHAVWLAREAVGLGEEIIIVLGDTVAEYDVKAMLSAPVSQVAVRKVDDPRLFGVAELSAEDRVLRVVEKPLIPRSNMALVGVYYIRESDDLFAALDAEVANLPADGLEECTLTEALQTLIDNGTEFHAFRVDNWYDCGKKESLLSTNAVLLRKMAEEGLFPTRLCELAARFPDVVIVPPVHIAPGCSFQHAIIGPNVSVGENTRISRAIVRDSIIGSYAEIGDIDLHSSIVGNDAFVRGTSQSLNIGDNTEIDLR